MAAKAVQSRTWNTLAKCLTFLLKMEFQIVDKIYFISIVSRTFMRNTTMQRRGEHYLHSSRQLLVVCLIEVMTSEVSRWPNNMELFLGGVAKWATREYTLEWLNYPSYYPLCTPYLLYRMLVNHKFPGDFKAPPNFTSLLTVVPRLRQPALQKGNHKYLGNAIPSLGQWVRGWTHVKGEGFESRMVKVMMLAVSLDQCSLVCGKNDL